MLPKCVADAPDYLAGFRVTQSNVPDRLIQPHHGAITMEVQKKRWWCWAAVAQAVFAAHWDPTQGDPMTQEEIAVGVRPNHCPAPPPPAPDLCNQPADLGPVLTTIGTRTRHPGGLPCSQVSLDDLERSLARHAIPCSFKLGSTVHFCLIVGLRFVPPTQNVFIRILDPWRGAEDEYPLKDLEVCHSHPELELDLDYLHFLT